MTCKGKCRGAGLVELPEPYRPVKCWRCDGSGVEPTEAELARQRKADSARLDREAKRMFEGLER